MLQVLVLERVEFAQNIHRFYVLAIEPTLFDDIALRREWGRLGSRGGASRLDLYADLDGAREALGIWLKRKRGRGYSVVV